MKNKKNKQRKQPSCICHLAKLVPQGWNRSPCPFQILSDNSHQIAKGSDDIFKQLACPCGKIVGQILYNSSSSHRLGEWKVQTCQETETNLPLFKQYLCLQYPKQLDKCSQNILRLTHLRTVIQHFTSQL